MKMLSDIVARARGANAGTTARSTIKTIANRSTERGNLNRSTLSFRVDIPMPDLDVSSDLN
jgi:hypothetical protein